MGWLDDGQFDYRCFRETFVFERSIEGRNPYERANARAEWRKGRQRAAQDAHWWMKRALWEEPGEGHSAVEAAAIDNILGDCIRPVVARRERVIEGPEPVKFCPTCGRWLRRNVEHFHANGDGLHSICRECRRASARDYWQRKRVERVTELLSG